MLNQYCDKIYNMKNSTKIRKAVITAAGYGTRFLPATKNQPKEMLPIIDKPIIHYLVDEAVNSGIETIILVTRAGNHILEDYFDNRSELENSLEKSGKMQTLQMIQDIPQMANFIYVRQKSHLPYGNGSPLLAVKELIDDNESFVYMFGDDLTISHNQFPITKQLIDIYQEQSATAVLATSEVSWDEIHKYASIKYKENAPYKYEMEEGIEKTTKDKAPSNMAQFGRFVFSYDVVEAAERTQTGKDGELWIIDILNTLAKEGKKIIAPPIQGEWLTTGDPINYLKATLKFAMLREDLKSQIRDFMQKEIK